MGNGLSRRLRLASGLVLFVFVLTHLLNHVLGLVSLSALEAGREYFLWIWRGWLGTLLLALAMPLHLGLAISALYRRRRLAMPPWEAMQYLLGFAVPPLLVIHILGTRYIHEIHGVDDSYLFVLLGVFVGNDFGIAKQSALLLIAWTHGCIGLHYWLRLRGWYQRIRFPVFGVMLLLPSLSLLGFWIALRDLTRLAADPVWHREALASLDPLSDQAADGLYTAERVILLGLLALVILALAGRGLRAWLKARRGLVSFGYPEGRRVTVTPGTSVLEASRSAGIPHASVCGGRGRCSTCRIRIGRGLEGLGEPATAEAKVLARVGAAPNVRLACQLRPTVDLDVTPLLPATAGPGDAQARPGYLQGEERELVILFADIRGFTTLSEKKLPYDVVFVLNRYFAAMGRAVESAGGRVDKFIGDGVMALFGVEGDPAEAPRRALEAARAMAEQLTVLNGTLAGDLDQPLRIGIGIHGGPVIVGEMGYGEARSLTAIGDAVNTASRLEGLTKEFGAQLVVSEPVALGAGLDLEAWPRRTTAVRGRDEELAVRVVSDAATLSTAGAVSARS